MELKKEQNESKLVGQTLVQHAAKGSIMVCTKVELAVLYGETCRNGQCEL